MITIHVANLDGVREKEANVFVNIDDDNMVDTNEVFISI